MSTLYIQLLGSFSLRADDTPVIGLPQARLQALLAYLVLHRHTAQPRRHLAFLFWPDSTEEQAYSNLRKALHALRSLLPEPDRFLQIDARTVQWRSETPAELDVVQFEQHVTQADRDAATQNWPSVHAHLAAAAELYAGDLLPDCYDDWLAPERERLRERFFDSLTRLSDLLEKAHEVPAAVRQTNRLLRHNPLHEESYRRLMRLHALQGDRAAALRAYHTCATLLQQELGVDPSPLTQELHTQLLRLETPVPAASPERGMRPHDVLVGRQAEWQRLLAVWQRAGQGQAHCVIIAGEAGIGKTRLAEELVRWVNHQGASAARTRAYVGEEGLAYAPLLDWLRSEPLHTAWARLEPVWLGELARLVPDLISPQTAPPAAPGERWQRQRLFEALSRALLSAPPPLLLLIDDLQWCDPETLAWLQYLLHFDPAARLLVVGTMRAEEVDAEHPLLSLLLTLRSAGLVSEIELGPLAAAETADLAVRVAERPLTQTVLDQLVRTTEGNPLFVTETVRAALGAVSAGGQAFTADAVISITLPVKVQAVIQQRLARLSPDARELVSVAAVIGRSFRLPVLAQAGGLAEDALVQGLDELWQRRIVREQGADAYDFSHDRIRDAAYAAISLARRRLLHRRVAEALEAVLAGGGATAAQVAFQYEQADLVKQAVAHYAQAAEAAHHVYAFEDSVRYFGKALDLLRTQPATPERSEQEVDLLCALGAAWTTIRTCASAEAQQAYDRAYTLSRQLTLSPRLFRALWGLHEFHQYRAEYARALDTAEECLRIAETLQDPTLRLEAHHALWGPLHFFNRYAAAVEQADLGLALYDHTVHQPLAFHYGSHDPGHCALSVAGIALWMSGYPDQARQRLHAAIALAAEFAQPLSQADAYYNHAQVYHLLGEPVAVRRWAEATLSLAHAHGFRYCQGVAAALAGWAMAVHGERQAGLDLLRQGIEMWRDEGMRSMQTYLTVLWVDACCAAGRLDEALASVMQGQGFAIEFDEHFFEPELYRLQGDLLAQQGALPPQVEACYRQALELARQQGAKMLELRSATSLARGWQARGSRQAAQDLLAPIYAWFTEGFATPDLQAAQRLLTALAS